MIITHLGGTSWLVEAESTTFKLALNEDNNTLDAAQAMADWHLTNLAGEESLEDVKKAAKANVVKLIQRKYEAHLNKYPNTERETFLEQRALAQSFGSPASDTNASTVAKATFDLMLVEQGIEPSPTARERLAERVIQKDAEFRDVWPKLVGLRSGAHNAIDVASTKDEVETIVTQVQQTLESGP